MAKNVQIVGLKACRAGAPLAKGVADTGSPDLIKAFTQITQPYDGGITANWSVPSNTEFRREGEVDPFFSMRDPSTGSKELTWTVADFDDETKEFYFGGENAIEGEVYEGEKAFAFDAKTGKTIVFARLKYVATLTGNINKGTPLQISVSATVLAPSEGGKSWDVIDTPAYTAAAIQSASLRSSKATI